MTENQLTELVKLRHRLRVMLNRGVRSADADQILDRMATLSRESGDASVGFERARWSVQLSTPRFQGAHA